MYYMGRVLDKFFCFSVLKSIKIRFLFFFKFMYFYIRYVYFFIYLVDVIGFVFNWGIMD